MTTREKGDGMILIINVFSQDLEQFPPLSDNTSHKRLYFYMLQTNLVSLSSYNKIKIECLN